MKPRFSRRQIPIAAQDTNIRSRFKVCSSDYHLSSGTWDIELQPSPLSQKYITRITYTLRDLPKVEIVKPLLILRSGATRIPHTYLGPRPCVFLPTTNEWNGTKLIAQTIIPWTIAWLYFYEVWLVTGEWIGRGIHPNKRENQDLES